MKRIKSRKRRRERINFCIFCLTIVFIIFAIYVLNNLEDLTEMILEYMPSVSHSTEQMFGMSQPGPLSDSIVNSAQNIQSAKIFVELSEKSL